jgi:hypothetical protein
VTKEITKKMPVVYFKRLDVSQHAGKGLSPPHFYSDYVRSDRGRFTRCEQVIDWKADEFGKPSLIEAKMSMEPERGAPILSWDEMEKCYELMEQRDITCVDAVLEIMGDDQVNRAWLEDAMKNPAKLKKWEPAVETPPAAREHGGAMSPTGPRMVHGPQV